jgi:hypothetical protein
MQGLIHCDLRAATKDDLVEARMMISFNHNALKSKVAAGPNEQQVMEVLYDDDIVDVAENEVASSSLTFTSTLSSSATASSSSSSSTSSSGSSSQTESASSSSSTTAALEGNQTYHQGNFETCDNDEAIARSLAEYDERPLQEGKRRMRSHRKKITK